MRVVHVVEALAGGVTTYFKDLSNFFGAVENSKGIETTIIYSDNRKEVDSEKVENEFSHGVDFVKINMVREFSVVNDFISTLKLIKTLKKIKPDIVHLHSSKAGVVGRIACFFVFNKKIKIYYTPHGYSFIRTDISSFSKKIYWFIEKNIQFIFGGTTIACGDTEYKIAKKIGKSILNRNGISVNEINQYYNKPENDVLTIGIVARITNARNPVLFNNIALRYPHYNFIWIGDGELNYKLNAPNIKITGWFMDTKSVLIELNNIDIYLQTSLWEGLPIAVLEAMALKKPVIATNVIGNKDAVLNNETGFLFNSIEELDNYFLFLSEEKNRIIFGEKALERCYAFFDKNKNFSSLSSIYINGL